MANEVKVTIRVEDDGTLNIVSKDAKKAAKSVDGVTKSTKRLNKAKEGLSVTQNTNNKLEKGTAQLGMNSTKAFSKQAQTLGGTLVPAYATLAANIFALTAAFGALQRAAAFEQLKQGLEVVGAAAGQNLPYVAQQLRQITDYAITTQEAMRSVAMGVSAGFSTKQLEDLTKVAKGASLALGRNMEDAMSRLVRGTAKIEPEILDELGIMVRLDRAAEKYAAQLGKTATQLTQFERRQAFLNETIEQGLQKFSFVADSVDANPYDKLIATFGDLQKATFRVLNSTLIPIMEILASNPTALLGVITVFASTIINKIVPGLNQAVAAQREVAAGAFEAATAAEAEAAARFDKMKAGVTISDVTPKSVVKAYEQQNFTTKQLQKNVQNLHRSEQRRLDWLRTYNAESAKYSKDHIALKEKELAQVRAEKRYYEEMLLIKKNLGTAGLEARAAGGRGLMAQLRAESVQSISDAGAFGGFKEAFKGAKEQFMVMGLVHKDIMDGMKENSKTASISIGDAFQNLKFRILNAFDSVKTRVNKVFDFIKESFNKLKATSIAAFNTIQNFTTLAIAKFKDFGKYVKNLTLEDIKNSYKNLSTVMSNSFEASKEVLKQFSASFGGLNSYLINLKNSAIAFFKEGFSNAITSMAALFDTIKTQAASAFGNMKMYFAKASERVKVFIADLKTLTFASITESIRNTFTTLTTSLGLSFASLDEFKASLTNVKLKLLELKGPALAFLMDVKANFLTAASYIGTLFTGIKERAIAAFNSIKQSILVASQSLSTLWLNIKAIEFGLLANSAKVFFTSFASGMGISFTYLLNFKKSLLATQFNFGTLKASALAALTSIKVGFTAAGGAAALFGRAILGAIPVVGQLLLVFSLFGPMLSKLFEKDRIGKKSDEIVESLNKLTYVGYQLEQSLTKASDSYERFYMGLKASVGITDQVVSGLNSIHEEAMKIRAEEISKQADEIIKIQKEIANPGFWASYDMDDLAEARQKMDELTKSRIELSAADALPVLATTIAQLKSFGPKEMLQGLDTDLEKIYDKIINGSVSSYEEVMKAVEKSREVYTKAFASIEAAMDANAEFQKQMAKLSQKRITPIDELVKSVQTLDNEFQTAAKAGEQSLGAFLKKVPEYEAAIAAKRKEMMDAADPTGLKRSIPQLKQELEARITIMDAAAEYRKELEKTQKVMLDYTGTMNQLKVTSKQLSDIKATNPEAAQKALDIEKEILSTREEYLKAQIKISNAEAKSKLGEELKAIQIAKEGLAIRERAGEVTTAYYKQQQQFLELQLKTVKNINDLEEAKVSIAKNLAKINAANENRGLTPDEELELAKEAARQKIQAASKEFDLASKRLRIETSILLAKNKLAQLQAKQLSQQAALQDKDIGVDASQYTQLASLIEESRDSQLALNEEKLKEVTITQQAIIAESELASRMKDRELKLEAIGAEGERLNTVGLKVLAVEKELAKATLERKNIQKDLNKLSLFNSQARQEKLLEIEGAKTRELGLQLKLIDEKYKREQEYEKLWDEINKESKNLEITIGQTLIGAAKLKAESARVSFTAADELKAFNQLYKAKKSLIYLETQSTFQRLQAEEEHYETIWKEKVSQAFAAGNDKEVNRLGKELEAERDRLEILKNQALESDDAKLTELEIERIKLKNLALAEELDAKWTAINRKAELYSFFLDEATASELILTRLQDERADIITKMIDARAMGQDAIVGEKLLAEFNAKELEIYGEQLRKISAITEQRLRLLDIEREITTLMESSSMALDRTIISRSKTSAAKMDRDWNAEDELKAVKLLSDNKIRIAQQEYKYTVDRLNEEESRTLKTLNLRLEKTKARGTPAQIANLEKEISLERERFAQRKMNADILKNETLELIRQEEAEAQRNYEIQKRETHYALLATRASMLAEQGLAELSAQQSLVAASKELVRLNKLKQANNYEGLNLSILNSQIEAKRLDVFKAQLAYIEASNEQQRIHVELNQQLVSSALDLNETQQKIAVTAAKINATIQNRDWNSEDELKAVRRMADIRNKQIEFEYRVRKEMAILEYNEQAGKLAMQIVSAAQSEDDAQVKRLRDRLNALGSIYLLQIAGIKNAQALAQAEEALLQIDLERQVYLDKQNAGWETRTLLVDALKEGGAVLAALDVEALNLDEQRIDAANRLKALQEGGLALVETTNDLFKAELALKANQIAKEKELLKTYQLEVDLIQEQYDTTLAIIKNQKIISNFLTGFGAKLTPAQEYEMQILAAEQALNMQRLQSDLKIRELEIQKSITNLTVVAAEASIAATRAKLDELKATANVDQLPGINQQIANLDQLSDTIKSSKESALTEVGRQIDLERQILSLKEQQAEQAIIAAKMSGPGGFLETGVAERFGHDAAISMINSMNSALSMFQNVSEVMTAQRVQKVQPLEQERETALLEYRAKLTDDSTTPEELEAFRIKVISIQEEINRVKEAGLTVGETISIGIASATLAISPMIEQLKQLGPEGEAVAAMAEGALTITSAWTSATSSIQEALDGMKENSISTFQGMMSMGAAVAQAISSTLSAISSIQQASSKSRIAAIDSEIEAEKKRDGQSAKSVAKINALEKKKEAQKRKAFEQNKKMMMAQTVVNTAGAIMTALATSGNIWVGIVMAAIAAAMGAAQLAVIAGTSYQGGGASSPSGPSKIAIGERSNTVDLAKSKSPSGELAYMRGERGYGDAGASNYIPGAFTGRATGGNTALLVGEQGPELFVPERPGTILPADDTARLAPPLNVNFSINTIDSQGMEDALIKQRGSIINMIREAANSKGGFFLEDINTLEEPV